MKSTPLAPRRAKFGPLDAVEFPAPAGAPTIVFFHGYGANGADLAPLAYELALTRPARWIFPDAPLTLDFGGLAWFQIDASAMERAQRAGKPLDWADREPAGFEEARQAASTFLKALGAPMSQITLGGFSQGSMLAIDLALSAKEAPRGLVILSGNLIRQKSWLALAPGRAGLPFFQSHGIADPILAYAGARKLESLLREAGLDGKLFPFEGGHSIPPKVASALTDWLNAL